MCDVRMVCLVCVWCVSGLCECGMCECGLCVCVVSGVSQIRCCRSVQNLLSFPVLL